MRDDVKTRAPQLDKFEIVMNMKVYLHTKFLQIYLIEPQITGFPLTVHGSIVEIIMQICFHLNYNFKFI